MRELLEKIFAEIKKNPGGVKAYEDLYYICVETMKTDEALGVQYLKLLSDCIEAQIPAAGSDKDLRFLFGLHKRVLLAAAPLDFESYLLYVEWNREPEKKFYVPRREVLRPIVQAMQDMIDDKIDLLTISMPPGTGKSIRHDVLMELFGRYVDNDHALWLLGKTVERSKVDVSYMTDEEYENCLNTVFNSLLYHYINKSLLTGEKFMGKHLNIGDQVAQTAGIFYPMRIDNFVKIVRSVKFYGRYMDDSYAIHESKEFLEELLTDIIGIAQELGITVNTRKTRICKLSDYWRFLQIQYSLTETGRVIQKINPKRLTDMRRKMKKLAPKLTEKEFTDWYKAWFKNHYRIMSRQQRSNMDILFNQLKEVTKCSTQSHSQTDES